jgi:putative transposase
MEGGYLMPYYARKHQLTGSLLYHVYNRSNGRDFIFNSDPDFNYFIQLLKDYSREFSVKIYHWVVMSNHYHFLIEMDAPEVISSFMAGLNRSYTCYYHKINGTSGFLWQGRFKLQPVQKDKHLTGCGRYIERNPVKAGLVLEASEYPYSSAAFYCLGKEDGLTSESPLFSQFGTDLNERRSRYKEFLKSFDSEEEMSFENIEVPAGSHEFIKRLKLQNGRYIPRRRGRLSKRFVL